MGFPTWLSPAKTEGNVSFSAIIKSVQVWSWSKKRDTLQIQLLQKGAIFLTVFTQILHLLTKPIILFTKSFQLYFENMTENVPEGPY